MAFVQTKNEVTFYLLDDENRERRRTVEIDNAFTVTDALASQMASFMRGTVYKYVYRQEQFDAAYAVGTLGDVNDKVNLIFRMPNGDKRAFPIYDVDQSCFVAATGSGARDIKPKAELELATLGTPESGLNLFINNILNGEILIAGDVVESYLEGYKVD